MPLSGNFNLCTIFINVINLIAEISYQNAGSVCLSILGCRTKQTPNPDKKSKLYPNLDRQESKEVVEVVGNENMI